MKETPTYPEPAPVPSSSREAKPVPASNVRVHPSSHAAERDRAVAKENRARALRFAAQAREQARDNIDAIRILSEITEIDCMLRPGKDVAGNLLPPDKEMVAALKARADIQFRLLDKVLPNLKSTESVSHNTHEHQHLHASLGQISDVELAQRLQMWRKDVNPLPEPALIPAAAANPATQPELQSTAIEEFL